LELLEQVLEQEVARGVVAGGDLVASETARTAFSAFYPRERMCGGKGKRVRLGCLLAESCFIYVVKNATASFVEIVGNGEGQRGEEGELGKGSRGSLRADASGARFAAFPSRAVRVVF
jgi:hypothetical protein